MAIPKEQLTDINIQVRDPDNELIKMLDYIRATAGIGHSFIVVVDPDLREYTKKFSIDGDGPFHINSLKMNGKKVKIKDDKILEKYLRSI